MKQTLALLGFTLLAAAMAVGQASSDRTDPGTQASPPVTSQTPAAQSPPTATTPKPTSEVGKSPANNAGESERAADRQSAAAQEGHLNRNPQTGKLAGRGIDNQGVNQPNASNPNPENAPAANTPVTSNSQRKNFNNRQTTAPWDDASGGNIGTPAPPH